MKKAAASLTLAAALALGTIPAIAIGQEATPGVNGTATETVMPAVPGEMGTPDSNATNTMHRNNDGSGRNMINNTMNDATHRNRTGTNSYSTNNYRASAADDGTTNWSWLGLLGLLGLAGLVGRSRERNNG